MTNNFPCSGASAERTDALNFMQCEQCNNKAQVKCEWGLYERSTNEQMNKAALCKQHSAELWQAIKGSVNAGMMHYTNKPI